jgi:hypothetical protein
MMHFDQYECTEIDCDYRYLNLDKVICTEVFVVVRRLFEELCGHFGAHLACTCVNLLIQELQMT